MNVRDEVIEQVLLGPMREEGFRRRDPGELDQALRELGFELSPDELKLVREVHRQAEGLDGERLDELLRANAGRPGLPQAFTSR
ncbi:MAG: hypothetical protein HY658_12375 [Actinobacteria bacterium]|nr:hypothetical protein [Actinomycetota bacterium]